MPELPQELGWVTAVFTDWPGPIAHEYRRLADLIAESRSPDVTTDYKVLGAFLQLRDFAEVLVALPSIIMLRDADRLGLDVTRIKSRLLNTPPSLGLWLWMAKDLAKTLRQCKEAFTLGLVDMFLDPKGKRTPFCGIMHALVDWRNRELGHGALRMDLDGLAAELAERITPLNAVLGSVAGRHPWRHLPIHLEGRDAPLAGWESIRSQHDGGYGSEHVERDLAVLCKPAGSRRSLNLAPYLAARACSKCGKQDVFFFNGRSPEEASRKIQYLDYMMGHSLVEPQDSDHRWKSEVTRLGIAKSRGAVGDGWIDDVLVELLDSTNAARDYVEPTHLADSVRDFLATHDRGILWLRAPAHTGKTVFASHAATTLATEPGDVLVAPFLIEREYRFGVGMFNAFLHNTFYRGRTNQYARKFRWDDRGTASMAQCFIEEAPNLLEQARELSSGNDRILLLLDGMDELPAPGVHGEPSDVNSIADLVPPADALPAGVYLLLTSRPDSAEETPDWVLERLHAATDGQKHARIIDVDRDTEAYRRLLRRCFDEQRTKKTWKGGPKNDPDSLFQAIGDRSDWTFLYFSHLLRLLHDGVITPDDISRMNERGERLFFAYMDRLETLLGEKEFGRVRELLLVLAACEEAHAQAAAIVPSLFFNSQWHGVPLDILAGMLHETCAGHRQGNATRPVSVSLRLLFLLHTVADVLRSYRMDDTYASYQIGLKGMVRAMREDQSPGGWASQLDDMHHRLVRDAIAAEKAFVTQPEDEDMTAAENYLLWKGWCHARALIHLGDPNRVADAARSLRTYELPETTLISVASAFGDDWLHADACETLSIAIDHLRWRLQSNVPKRRSAEVDELARAYCLRANLRGDHLDRDGAEADYETAIGIIESAMTTSGRRVPWNLRYGQAITLMNRNAHFANFGDTSAAREAFSQTIALFQTLRKNAPVDRKADLERILATAYTNRGTRRCDEGDLDGASDDCDQAITILKQLRANRSSRWDPELCSDLASALTKRGLILKDLNENARASRDFAEAIALLEKYIDKHEDDWSNDAWHTLALAYGNRGGLTPEGQDPARAVKDFSMAIFYLKSLWDFHGVEGPTGIGDELATMYQNRGNIHESSRRFRKAIADFGRAIDIYESLRKDLGERWSPDFAEILADLHKRRGKTRVSIKDTSAATKDFDLADEGYGHTIALRKAAVGVKETHWSSVDRFQLARCLAHRSNVRSLRNDIAGSLSDSAEATALIERFLTDVQHASAAELVNWYDIVAVAYGTRADLHDETGDLAAAVSDYTRAIEAMEMLGGRLGPGWSGDMKRTLTELYRSRAEVHEKQRAEAAAAADRRRADELEG